MEKKALVTCEDCSFFKQQSIERVSTEHLEGEIFESHFISSLMTDEEKEKIKEESRIKHHRIQTPSGCARTLITMCSHSDCFVWEGFAIMGIPCSQRVRVKGQAQFNPYGECKRYKRKFWKFWKPKKAV